MKKTVLVTGASRGIGRATAALFGKNQFNVAVNYLHSETKALSLVRQLQENGGSAAAFQADISLAGQAEAMIDKIRQAFGTGVDILVNNAGIAQTKLFSDISEADWDRMMAVNVKGMFHCIQAVLPDMIHNKSGKIINLSSVWGIGGGSCEVHYSASKAAVIGLTKALAKELGPSSIQVNCVAPGVIGTDMLAGLSGGDLAALAEDTPLGRLGTPEDIAQAVYFLASPAADFITGQILSPNGGFVI